MSQTTIGTIEEAEAYMIREQQLKLTLLGSKTWSKQTCLYMDSTKVIWIFSLFCFNNMLTTALLLYAKQVETNSSVMWSFAISVAQLDMFKSQMEFWQLKLYVGWTSPTQLCVAHLLLCHHTSEIMTDSKHTKGMPLWRVHIVVFGYPTGSSIPLLLGPTLHSN